MTTDRTTHRWSQDEIDFLLSMPTAPRKELVARFREAFPKFEGSDTSINNRRYVLLHKSTGPRAVEALAALVASLETSLAKARTDLEEAKTAATEKAATKAKATKKAKKAAKVEAPIEVPTPEEIDAALINRPINELREIAKANGVKANGSKAAIVARIEAAMN